MTEPIVADLRQGLKDLLDATEPADHSQWLKYIGSMKGDSAVRDIQALPDNGHLYAPGNGTAAGGNTPASPPGVTPAIPALTGVATQDDFLFDVVPGGYYGHPNPTRNEFVLGSGWPGTAFPAHRIADYAQFGSVPANPNYRGYIYSSDMFKGLDVLQLTGVTSNEAEITQLNPQTQ